MKRLLLLIAMMVAGYSFTWAQRDVTGQVFDNENRTPLQGISIIVKNTRVGTTTDAEGKFRLSVPAGARTLVFTSTNFNAKEVTLTEGQNEYLAALDKNVVALNEVVVAVPWR